MCGKQFGNLHARLATAGVNFQGLPRIGAFAKSMRFVFRPFAASAEMRLTVALRQLGLRIERVDMADAAVHEQVDDALGLRGAGAAAFGASGFAPAAWSIEAKRHRSEAAAGLRSEDHVWIDVFIALNPRKEIRWC